MVSIAGPRVSTLDAGERSSRGGTLMRTQTAYQKWIVRIVRAVLIGVAIVWITLLLAVAAPELTAFAILVVLPPAAICAVVVGWRRRLADAMDTALRLYPARGKARGVRVPSLLSLYFSLWRPRLTELRKTTDRYRFLTSCTLRLSDEGVAVTEWIGCFLWVFLGRKRLFIPWRCLSRWMEFPEGAWWPGWLARLEWRRCVELRIADTELALFVPKRSWTRVLAGRITPDPEAHLAPSGKEFT
jgi:hypothetical protein